MKDLRIGKVNMFKYKVFPYKLGSQSAKVLAQSLGVKRIKPTYTPRRNEIIINWGRSTNVDHYPVSEYDLNPSYAIATACNKLKTFKELEQFGFEHLPIWSDSRYEIYNLWANHPDKTVYCRTSLTGHSGSGIIIATNSYELVDAPLYTIQTKHKYEFRVHVFKGKVIDVQQKKKRAGVESNSAIRNHSNGYVYARCDITVPSIVLEASAKAVSIIGLDFGAVDIGYRERDNKAFVFEINTAPGLVGTTIEVYKNAFNNYLRSLNNG